MSNPAKIGIFSTITVAIFILGFYFLKGTNLFERSNTYYAVFNRVDGLYKSNLVELNGLQVGMVGDMERDPKTGEIIVSLNLDKDVQVPDAEGTFAQLVPVDLLGTKKIKLVFGKSDKVIPEGGTIKTFYKLDISEQLGDLSPVINGVKSIVPNVDSTISNINWLFDERNPNGIYSTKAEIDLILKTNAATLKLTILNIESITANIKKNNETIDAFLKNMKDVSDSVEQANLKQTIENLNATITELNGIVKDLNDGKGTLGKLIKEDELYAHVDSTVMNLNRLAKDIKDRPYRYINVSVFGAKKHEERMEQKYNESGK